MTFRWRRAAPLAGIAVITAGVVLIALFHHVPPAPKTVVGPTHLFSSTSNEGRSALSRMPPPNETNIFNWNGPAAGAARQARPSVHRAATEASAQNRPAPPPNRSTRTVQELAGQFPALAHQVFVSVPQSGSEPEYFARLGNLVNGTPVHRGARIPATADHLAHAQANLNRDNLAGAIADVQAISGPAADIMHSWVADAKAHLAMARRQPQTDSRIAQNSPPVRRWPHVLPTEIPPYARQSTGPEPK
jgi:hypothetical protein